MPIAPANWEGFGRRASCGAEGRICQPADHRTHAPGGAGRPWPADHYPGQYSAGAAVPEGLYINVSFPTRFANSAQPVRELVSFRFDEDQVWRLAGYSLRASAP